jgi:hypothetical protein
MVESDKSESSTPTGGATSVKEAPAPVATKPSRARPDIDVPALLGKGLNLLASLVRLITLLFAVVLVAYVIFTWFDANQGNPWAVFVSDWAHRVSLGLDNLFTPADPKVSILVNFGIAAVAWLVIGAIVGKLLRRG